MAKKKQRSHKNWHPDFRVKAELPDIKIIRTDFLINGIAGFVALILVFMVISQEFTLSAQRSEIDNLESEILAFTEGNAANLNTSKNFKDSGPLILDIERFFTIPVDPVASVIAISEVIPEGILLDSISFNESTHQIKKRDFTNYRVRILGVAPTLESISELKEAVEAAEFVSQHPNNVVERPSPRDEATGFFNFQIDVIINPLYK